VSASSDKTLKIWDILSGQETYTLKGHTSTVTGCSISPDSIKFIYEQGNTPTRQLVSPKVGKLIAGHTSFVERGWYYQKANTIIM